MGSLAALLSRSGPPDTERVNRMVQAAPHRGTDVARVTHGHAVLAVGSGDGAGLSEVAAEGDLAAAFTGHLDNVEELAREVAPEQPAASLSTALVVLRAFRAHGPGVVHKFRGPFSGVVTDGHTLWSFRDHVGYKPLVYRDDGTCVYAATEVKQVVAGSGLSYEPDLEVLENIFYSTTGDDPRCAVRGVEQVRQGGIVTSDGRGSRWSRYWDPRDYLETGRYSEAELQERFDEVMAQAAARCLKGADAVSLSGGVDSPAVAAYAAPLHQERWGRPLAAVSAVYPAFPTVDESRYITRVAEELGLELHTYEPQTGATDGVVDWVRLFDGPVPVVSLSQTYEILERARRLGYRNLLTGEMAEFVFDARSSVLDYLLAMGRVGSAIRHSATSGAVRPTRLARRAARALLPGPVLARYRTLRPLPARRAPAWVDAGRLTPPPLLSGRQKWREDQVLTLQGGTLPLQADDYLQSVAGVSTRRPWTDLDVWQFFLGLPAQIKHPASRPKALVRHLLRGRVPDVILDRRDKTVFDAAIAASIDYDFLGRWLIEPVHRVEGVRYDLLADRLRRRELNLVEFMYAKDLAGVHVFLSLCEAGVSVEGLGMTGGISR
jgi:asparagine synthase (glutamine-hydrolysing)